MSLAKFVFWAVALLPCAVQPVAAQPRAGGPPGGAGQFGVLRPGLPHAYPPGPPPVAPPAPLDPPMRVMTDTPEYCMHLARLVERTESVRAVSPDVHVLAVTGRQMCEHGLLFGGLQRLRLALMLLRSGQ